MRTVSLKTLKAVMLLLTENNYFLRFISQRKAASYKLKIPYELSK